VLKTQNSCHILEPAQVRYVSSEGCGLKEGEALGGTFFEMSWMGSESRSNLGDQAIWSLTFMECAALTLQ
jgi:hypothetical protein